VSGTLQTTIPSYLYQEYSDDDALQAFVASYNQLAQTYVSSFNQLNLPIYTQPPVSGAVLDWVAQGLYGIIRPTLAATVYHVAEAFNTYQLNQIPIDGKSTLSTSTFYPVTDDIFRRILTWNLYKGDGRVFSAKWLKKRVARFLLGANGAPLPVADTQSVGVTYTSSSHIVVTIDLGGTITSTLVAILAAAIAQNDCPLPPFYTYSFTTIPFVPGVYNQTLYSFSVYS